MNFLVFLDAGAGELEKILSGTKCMLLKECDPADAPHLMVIPGDNLYFLRHKGDCDLRVKATVTHVLSFTNQKGEDLSHTLKEMQTRLQLTEEQYNEWSVKGQFMLVEFGSTHKIGAIHIMQAKITNQTGWIPFKELDQITQVSCTS